jgi:hypothetical protein
VLVCPNCRNENQEEARFCQVCGRSLDPVESTLRRTDLIEGAEDELDVAPPKPPSAVPGIIAIAVIVLIVLGAGVLFAMRPNPCEGKFVSPLYGYCIAIPVGWTGGSIRTPVGATDVYRPRSREAVVQVRSGEVAPGVTTPQYAQGFRTTQEAAGFAVGPTQTVAVGGEDTGVAWEISGTDTDLGVVRQREVVFVRSGQGWRITLAGPAETFDEARVAFEELLASWGWRPG